MPEFEKWANPGLEDLLCGTNILYQIKFYEMSTLDTSIVLCTFRYFWATKKPWHAAKTFPITVELVPERHENVSS